MDNDLEKYSGEEYYRRQPRLDLAYIKLDGNKGVFMKSKKVEDEYVKENIGESIEGVILRVRRRLTSYDDASNSFDSTSEHNTPKDVVALFHENIKIDEGVASVLREKYKTLRTEQILYVYMLGEVCKLSVKGASLGSKNKPEDAVSFYDYLASFPKEEHVWQFRTRFVPVAEKKGAKEYFAISFEKGEKLQEEELGGIGLEMKKLHDYFESSVKYSGTKEEIKSVEVEKKLEEEIPVDESHKSDLPSIDIDEDRIDPKDLPF